MNEKTLVRAQNLHKQYQSSAGVVQALDGVDITVRKGEIVAIVGPTGSGKTTLIGLLAGLEQPDNGTVELMGRDLSTLGSDALTDLRTQAVGVIYQSFNLFPGFTVRENIGLPLRLMFQPPFDAHQRSGTLLAELGLNDIANRYPPELSGGQQQMVTVARALSTNPPLILADEPTANLDSTASRQIVNRLRTLADDGEHGVLIATHDLRTASQADRVLNMRDGQIIKETTMGEERRSTSELLAEMA